MNALTKWLGAALIAFVLSSGHLLSGPRIWTPLKTLPPRSQH